MKNRAAGKQLKLWLRERKYRLAQGKQIEVEWLDHIAKYARANPEALSVVDPKERANIVDTDAEVSRTAVLRAIQSIQT